MLSLIEWMEAFSTDKIALNDAHKESIRDRLSNLWDVNELYWYPIYSCSRDDVIALDSNYIVMNQKLKDIKRWLLGMDINKMYELRENGLAYEIINIEDYDLWESDDYFWNNEGYWFDQTFEWIIYLSHEQTMTFGGDVIIHRLKTEWEDWDMHLKWDTKNKG
jgi:hypothetical protein